MAQHIYVYTDHVKANYSPNIRIFYIVSTGNSGMLKMEPES